MQSTEKFLIYASRAQKKYSPVLKTTSPQVYETTSRAKPAVLGLWSKGRRSNV